MSNKQNITRLYQNVSYRSIKSLNAYKAQVYKLKKVATLFKKREFYIGLLNI